MNIKLWISERDITFTRKHKLFFVVSLVVFHTFVATHRRSEGHGCDQRQQEADQSVRYRWEQRRRTAFLLWPLGRCLCHVQNCACAMCGIVLVSCADRCLCRVRKYVCVMYWFVLALCVGLCFCYVQVCVCVMCVLVFVSVCVHLAYLYTCHVRILVCVMCGLVSVSCAVLCAGLCVCHVRLCVCVMQALVFELREFSFEHRYVDCCPRHVIVWDALITYCCQLVHGDHELNVGVWIKRCFSH